MYARGTQVMGDRSPVRWSFVRWCLEFWGGSWIFGKKEVVVPWVTILCSKQEGLRCQTETFPEFKLLLIPSCAQLRFISLLLLLRWPYSPVRPLTSRRWTSHSVDLSFQFVILRLLISVCTKFHLLFSGLFISIFSQVSEFISFENEVVYR
jgi:hypothetical protein